MISGIAFVGVENAKVMLQMAEGEMSTLKGLDQMGKNTVAMFGGLGLTELVKGLKRGARALKEGAKRVLNWLF